MSRFEEALRLARAGTKGASAAIGSLAGGPRAAVGAGLMSAVAGYGGVGMKLAQVLGLETDLVGDAIARELARSHYKAPGVSAFLIEVAVSRTFGQPTARLFDTFEPFPAAAASIGQVHRATYRGERVAVKVQYPDIRRQIATDLSRLALLGGQIPGVTELVVEVRARLEEELDYAHEAAMTTFFAERLMVEGLRVPRVVAERTRGGVLTTEYLDGLHCDEWLRDVRPDEATRDRLAERLYRAFVLSLRQLHRVHADPNLGNVMFLRSGDVALLDFGCVKDVSPELLALRDRIVDGACGERRAELDRLYVDTGIVTDSASSAGRALIAAHLEPTERWLAKIHAPVTRDAVALDALLAEGRTAFQKLTGHAEVRFPSALLYVERAHFGLLRLIARMGARFGATSAGPVA